MKLSSKQRTSLTFICILTALLIVICIVFGVFYYLLNALVSGTYSDASAKEISNALSDGKTLADQVEGEGIVLAQNNGVLPLDKTVKKVNVFGWSATQWVYGGSGSGRCAEMKTDFLSALTSADVQYNAELISMYRRFRSDRPFYNNTVGSLNSHNYEFSRLYEPSLEDNSFYTDSLLANAKEFSDTAIVVLGRVSGESNDSPKIQYKQVAKNGDIIEDATRTYLEISSEEQELLTYVGANYANVIVLVNSTNTMQLGFVQTIDGLDGCLIVGGTGEDAATAVVKVIYGDVNPSGRTVDTYAYDFSTNASYANAGIEGENAYTNSQGLYPCGINNANVGAKENYENVYYVDYVEGIYVGYKWYETADVEGFWIDVDNVYGKGYDGVVQYPFGFGLSYTTFDWTIVEVSPSANSALTKNDAITVKVQVQNSGTKAGKDVVQLYYSAPYYDGEIEKSSVELCAYAKTGLLQPGDKETVTLSLRVYDMASYDCYDKNQNGFCGYEVEQGDYVLKLMRDAHHQASGTADINYTVADGIKYSSDPDTLQTVGNKFTGEAAIDGVSVDGSDSNADIVYLARNNFKSTFPAKKSAARAMTENVQKYNLYTEEMATAWADQSAQPIKCGEDNGLVVYDQNGVTELGLALGANYDDPRWESLLNQYTVEEMIQLFYHYYLMPNAGVESIGKYKVFEADGPCQIGSFNAARHGTGFPMATVISQTWNKDLACAFGRQIGREAADLGYDGWYAPGINIHRTPFGGRNYEYYSEDDYLSGSLCSEVVNGALDMGIYCYIKHFIAYDQDGNRDSLYVWMTEQTLRESYLKPFEIAVKSGATGIMTSYNRLGAVWTGGSKALQTDVLRGEWQFKGAILTDYSDHSQYVNSDHSLRAGGDQILYGFGGNVDFQFDTQSNSFKQAIRRAAKNSTYIWLNALYRNKTSGLPLRANRVAVGGWLLPVFVTFGVLAFGGLSLWLYKTLKKKPSENTDEKAA